MISPKQILKKRSGRVDVFCKKSISKNFRKFTGKHPCWRPEAYKFIKKDTPAQVFSCEFSEIFKNTFFLKNTFSSCF